MQFEYIELPHLSVTCQIGNPGNPSQNIQTWQGKITWLTYHISKVRVWCIPFLDNPTQHLGFWSQLQPHQAPASPRGADHVVLGSENLEPIPMVSNLMLVVNPGFTITNLSHFYTLLQTHTRLCQNCQRPLTHVGRALVYLESAPNTV